MLQRKVTSATAHKVTSHPHEPPMMPKRTLEIGPKIGQNWGENLGGFPCITNYIRVVVDYSTMQGKVTSQRSYLANHAQSRYGMWRIG